MKCLLLLCVLAVITVQQTDARKSQRKEACCHYAWKGAYAPDMLKRYSKNDLGSHAFWTFDDEYLRKFCKKQHNLKIGRVHRPYPFGKWEMRPMSERRRKCDNNKCGRNKGKHQPNEYKKDDDMKKSVPIIGGYEDRSMPAHPIKTSLPGNYGGKKPGHGQKDGHDGKKSDHHSKGHHAAGHGDGNKHHKPIPVKGGGGHHYGGSSGKPIAKKSGHPVKKG